MAIGGVVIFLRPGRGSSDRRRSWLFPLAHRRLPTPDLYARCNYVRRAGGRGQVREWASGRPGRTYE